MPTLDDVFLNLMPEERRSAEMWFDDLRTPEKARILSTLEILSKYNLTLRTIYDDLVRKKFAIVVAGSSIDTDNYTDIDLFLIAEDSLSTEDGYQADPKTQIAGDLKRMLPAGVEYIIYGQSHKMMNKRDIVEARQTKINAGLGADVEVSLFYEMKAKRPDHPDDMEEIKAGAEGIIAHNRGIGSKFLVLSRQYPITSG